MRQNDYSIITYIIRNCEKEQQYHFAEPDFSKSSSGFCK